MTTDKPSAGELKPCPFCGEKRVSLNEPSKHYRYGSINCPACLATMPGEVRDQDELIGCWNTRPPVAGAEVGVPREPTEAMLHAARDWSREKYGKPIGSDAATGCWLAMFSAASLSPHVAERADLAPTAWLVDGPLPLDSSEVFLIHEKALAAFNDWGKRITPGDCKPAQGGLPSNCDNCGRAFLPDDTVFASINHGVRRTVHLKCDLAGPVAERGESGPVLPPLVDRGELIALLEDLASVNLSREPCERQARRIADDLIARGLFTSTTRAPVAERGGPLMPAKLTGELACIIECCDPPEHQTDEAVERLIFDYQPMWDRLRAAVAERGGGGRFCPEGHILMPQSRDEAEKMYLLAAKYLFPDGSGAERGGGGAQTLQDRDETLRGLAAFFSGSVHHVWSNDEISDCLSDMIATPETGDGSDTRPERGGAA